MAPAPALVVPARFNGPPTSGNGGYVAGRLAGLLREHAPEVGSGAVTVTLREPPPLDVRLDLHLGDDGVLQATFGGAVIATAGPGTLETDPVEPVAAEQARAAEARYAGLQAHPFPGCFVCGPHRPAGDGLGLRPGRLDGDARVACSWTPRADPGTGEVPAEMVWSALDCPSGWAGDLEDRPMVLGRITGCVDALPVPDETCVVVARALRTQGRKTLTASTVHDADGRVLGRAEALWIALR